ncbi:hypothetical protein AVEN_269921-1 [Araneus ventricosus]|uniref:Uncharacterized protein n=1 Tax=Araneus ventricosus TaxID=182803 RepID=A0A4Y2FRC6_ARAVE|nr:hypothetical protein AVEN_269921-1 [Araneus ventricosus]
MCKLQLVTKPHICLRTVFHLFAFRPGQIRRQDLQGSLFGSPFSSRFDTTQSRGRGGDEANDELGALSLDGSFFLTSESEDSYILSDIEKEMTTDHQEAPLPKELELRAGSQPLKYALWAKVELNRGKRFGPIPAQLKDTEPTRFSAWRVHAASFHNVAPKKQTKLNEELLSYDTRINGKISNLWEAILEHTDA